MSLRNFCIDQILRIKFLFRKDKELYRSIYRILGFYPKHIHPYKVALLHKSMGVKEEGKRINNERLEFLGDAVLSAVVGDIVFRHFPKKPEGFLTNTRSNIVKRQSLNKIAQETGLDKLIVSNFKQHTHNNYIYGNAFEALVGAIYLDRGYGHCMRFVEKRIINQLVNIDKAAYGEVNYKSKIIEWGQKNHVGIDFLVEENKDEKNNPIFLCKVMILGVACGKGKGYSKKESQQFAAKESLGKINSDEKFRQMLFSKMEEQKKETTEKETSPAPAPQAPTESIDIDFSDISMREKTREEIIADAEAKAFEK